MADTINLNRCSSLRTEDELSESTSDENTSDLFDNNLNESLTPPKRSRIERTSSWPVFSPAASVESEFRSQLSLALKFFFKSLASSTSPKSCDSEAYENAPGSLVDKQRLQSLYEGMARLFYVPTEYWQSSHVVPRSDLEKNDLRSPQVSTFNEGEHSSQEDLSDVEGQEKVVTGTNYDVASPGDFPRNPGAGRPKREYCPRNGESQSECELLEQNLNDISVRESMQDLAKIFEGKPSQMSDVQLISIRDANCEKFEKNKWVSVKDFVGETSHDQTKSCTGNSAVSPSCSQEVAHYSERNKVSPPFAGCIRACYSSRFCERENDSGKFASGNAFSEFQRDVHAESNQSKTRRTLDFSKLPSSSHGAQKSQTLLLEIRSKSFESLHLNSSTDEKTAGEPEKSDCPRYRQTLGRKVSSMSELSQIAETCGRTDKVQSSPESLESVGTSDTRNNVIFLSELFDLFRVPHSPRHTPSPSELFDGTKAHDASCEVSSPSNSSDRFGPSHGKTSRKFSGMSDKIVDYNSPAGNKLTWNQRVEHSRCEQNNGLTGQSLAEQNVLSSSQGSETFSPSRPLNVLRVPTCRWHAGSDNICLYCGPFYSRQLVLEQPTPTSCTADQSTSSDNLSIEGPDGTSSPVHGIIKEVSTNISPVVGASKESHVLEYFQSHEFPEKTWEKCVEALLNNDE